MSVIGSVGSPPQYTPPVSSEAAEPSAEEAGETTAQEASEQPSQPSAAAPGTGLVVNTSA